MDEHQIYELHISAVIVSSRLALLIIKIILMNLERRWFLYDNHDQSEWYEQTWRLPEVPTWWERWESWELLIGPHSHIWDFNAVWDHSHIWSSIIVSDLVVIVWDHYENYGSLSLSLPQKMTLSFDCQSGVPNNLVGTGCMWCWRWWRWRWQINP